MINAKHIADALKRHLACVSNKDERYIPGIHPVYSTGSPHKFGPVDFKVNTDLFYYYVSSDERDTTLVKGKLQPRYGEVVVFTY